jgi:AcrR family transcriptional regulator
MPRPRSLTPVLLAKAALTVIERYGAFDLSMRAVAEELGMGTMSLYRYVQSRGQLEALVVDLVLDPGHGGPDADVTRYKGWVDKVTQLALRAHAAATEHPAVTPLLLAHRHASIHTLRWSEAMLGVLAEAGFAGERRVIAFRTIVAYVFGAMQLEHFAPLRGKGTEAIAALPRDAFPLLAETAKSARKISPDAEFLNGLKLVLRGIAAR